MARASSRLAGIHQDRIVHSGPLATPCEPWADPIIRPMFLDSRTELTTCPPPSPSSWEASRTGRPCATPPKRSRALGIACEKRIVSAHRTPDRLFAFAKGAKAAGFKIIIAGAGGAAHLPGMTASLTELPVFGVPDRIQGAVRRRFALFDRADAGRRPGRDAGDRQGRRHQRRAARGQRAGAERSGARGQARRLAQAQTDAVGERPEESA